MSGLTDEKFILVRNLVYLFYLSNPEVTPGRMFVIWDQNKVLKEYPRLDLEILRKLLAEIKEKLN